MKKYIIKSVISLISIVLIYLLQACTNSIAKSFIDEDYTVPQGFDSRKENVTYGEIKDIVYYSTTTENNRKAKVILPPHYNSNKEYPVLYLFHGIGGDENEWFGGNPNEVVNNLVSQGKSKEMIIVIPNIRARHDSIKKAPEFFSVEHFREFDNFLNDMRNDLKPYIEENYPVRKGRDNHAVAGLSMGGRAALHIGINMIDDFAYIGALTPAVGVLPYNVEKGLFNSESLTLPDKYKENTLIMIEKGNKDGVVGNWPEEYSKVLRNNGVKHIYYVTDGGHDFTVWKNGLYNFTRRLFQ